MSLEVEPLLSRRHHSLVEDRLALIRSRIESKDNIPVATKSELLTLVAALDSELSLLAETHRDEAASITRFAHVFAHETSRSPGNPSLAETALRGLRISIKGFEETNPLLVGTVSRFASALVEYGPLS